MRSNASDLLIMGFVPTEIGPAEGDLVCSPKPAAGFVGEVITDTESMLWPMPLPAGRPHAGETVLMSGKSIHVSRGTQC